MSCWSRGNGWSRALPLAHAALTPLQCAVWRLKASVSRLWFSENPALTPLISQCSRPVIRAPSVTKVDFKFFTLCTFQRLTCTSRAAALQFSFNWIEPTTACPPNGRKAKKWKKTASNFITNAVFFNVNITNIILHKIIYNKRTQTNVDYGRD